MGGQFIDNQFQVLGQNVKIRNCQYTQCSRYNEIQDTTQKLFNVNLHKKQRTKTGAPTATPVT